MAARMPLMASRSSPANVADISANVADIAANVADRAAVMEK